MDTSRTQGNGDFTTAADWSTGTVPGAADIANINADGCSANYQVVF